jgi:hypothetical protein
LREWDAERGVKRHSKYAKFFDSDRKEDFLSEIAYLMTYRIKAKRFSSSDLIQCYDEAYESFLLPKEQADIVVGVLVQRELDKSGFRLSYSRDPMAREGHNLRRPWGSAPEPGVFEA